jgi:hypothetical protein
MRGRKSTNAEIPNAIKYSVQNVQEGGSIPVARNVILQQLARLAILKSVDKFIYFHLVRNWLQNWLQNQKTLSPLETEG